MSIRPILEVLLGDKLFELASLFTGDETARTMIVSSDILAAVTPPFPDTPEGLRLGEFRAWLDNFMEGGEISVAQDPFRKPPDAMLARIDPVASELWSVRITEPEQTPGVRGFGGFAEKDKFVALTWEYRETIIDFDAAVDDVITAWDELFQPYKPLKGSSLDEYLSNYRPV